MGKFFLLDGGGVIALTAVLIGAAALRYRLRARGRPALAYVSLLLTLGLPATLVFFTAGIFADIFLFGFDIDNKAPAWSKFVMSTVTVTGTLGAVGLSCLVARMDVLAYFRPRRDLAADYGEHGVGRPE